MERFKLKEISEKLNKIDVFICSASFERRCLLIPREISKIPIGRILLCHNKNHINDNGDNKNQIYNMFRSEKHILEFFSYDPVHNAIEFITYLNKTKSQFPQTFVIDITTFTHETLLILYYFLKLILTEKDKLIALYLDVDEYSINEKKPEDKWLSKGIGEIRSVLGYPGVFSPAKKNHLIILFGFESERTKKLIETYESNVVSLAFGPEELSTQKQHYYINSERHQELLKNYPESDQFKISLIDPIQAKKEIQNQIEKYNDYNTLIAPMNNKISTLGAALVAYENKNVQLCYVTANQYNINGYSEPGNNCYLFNL
ncbi:MAG: hypothetical protein ABSF32_07865 [Ignavibacteria bacterium]|jgi:hypothetical protein